MMRENDLRFISELRRNSRDTLTNISKRIRMPISTLYDKLRIHENGVILKHTTLLDFAKIGFNCRANLLLKTTKEDRDKLASYLKAHPVVNNLYKINNGYDYLAEAIFPHIKDLEDFLEELDGKFHIELKNLHYIIEDIKREEFEMERLKVEA